MIIEIPKDAKIIKMKSNTIWFDKDGVLYAIPNEHIPVQQSMEEIKIEMDRFRKIIGEKKVCIIIESDSKSSSPPKNQRDFIANEINSVTKAMAIISSSPLSRMVANLFFSFKPPAYPFKMFANEKRERCHVPDQKFW